jgi:hypothetical protein
MGGSHGVAVEPWRAQCASTLPPKRSSTRAPALWIVAARHETIALNIARVRQNSNPARLLARAAEISGGVTESRRARHCLSEAHCQREAANPALTWLKPFLKR